MGEALRGAAGSVSPEFAKKDGKCDERMEKYKIAIMGASGAGRTIFLCSYFNMAFSAAVKRKRQRRPISVKSQDDGIVDKFITFLFKQPKPVPWIIRRRMDLSLYEDSLDTDFSFCVDSLDMDITLFDVPRDYCYQDMDRWTETDFVPGLRTADGVLFFLSGEDIAKGTQDRKLIMTFAHAISLVRGSQGGRRKGRQDVPITFIFTKGDTIPDWDIDKLKEKISVLCDTADSNSNTGTLLRSLFVKGKNVAYFKSSALGKWLDPRTPPRNYQPENVVEPMEDLYEAMHRVRKQHKRRKLEAAVAVAALCLLLFWGCCRLFGFWH